MTPIDPAQAVKLARIRMALRRATGKTVDVEALLLGGSAQATASIKEWRALGVAELNQLLDHWVAESTGAPARAPSPAKAPGGAPAAPAAAPTDPPTDPPDPKSPTDRRYLRGAR
jgi:hypothetical protein